MLPSFCLNLQKEYNGSMPEERKEIRCSKCDRVLAIINGNDITVLKYRDRGNPVTVKVRAQFDSGGRFEVHCDNCDAGGGFSFGRTVKTLPLEYVIAPKKPGENGPLQGEQKG